MKVRVKYAKTGPLKFISHLDVMRYFQKNIRRAGLDIAYSTGLSPHEIISFAAPMPLMLTSEAEYFDAEFNSLPEKKEFINRLNETGVPELKVLDAALLPEKCLNSMAAVTASLYRVNLSERGVREIKENWLSEMRDVLERLTDDKEIIVIKKTKKKEEPTDIRPMIHIVEMREPGEEYLLEWGNGHQSRYCHEDEEKGYSVYMLLAAGSKINLRPADILKEVCSRTGEECIRFHYDIHRLETCMDMQEGGRGFLSLIDAGSDW